MNHRIVLAALPLALVTVPAMAQAPSAAPPAAALPAATTATAGERAERAPRFNALAVGSSGLFQAAALLQMWAIGARVENPETASAEWTSTFRVRRAVLRARGEIIPETVTYQLVFDVARLLDFQNRGAEVAGGQPAPNSPGYVTVAEPPSGNVAILQDVVLSYVTSYVEVSVGQFKVPVSLEGIASASRLYFPERALVARHFGNRRDVGVRVAKKLEVFGYTFGFYNGEGPNKPDSNDQKDLALRLELYPVEGVTAAVVGYAAVGQRHLPGTKDRLEGDIKIDIDDFRFQAEYIHGWDVAADGRRVPGRGFYVLAGYTFFDQLQPVVRIGALDPDASRDEHRADAIDPKDEHTVYEVGASYYLDAHACKLQLAGAVADPEQRSAPTRLELTLAAQIAF